MTTSPWRNYVDRPKRTPPTVHSRPHTVHVIGSGPAQFDVILDSGTDEPAHIVTLTRDLAYILKAELTRKLDETL